MFNGDFAGGATEEEKGFKAPSPTVKKRTYYEMLGVRDDASEGDINKAFKKLAIGVHPDKPTNAGKEEQFIQLTNARDILLDPEKRAMYDRVRNLNTQPASSKSSKKRAAQQSSGEIFPEKKDEWSINERIKDNKRRNLESLFLIQAKDKNGKIAERSKSIFVRLVKFINFDDTVAYAEKLKKFIDEDHDSAKLLDRMLTEHEQKYEQARAKLFEFIKGPDASNPKQLLPLLRGYGMYRLDLFNFKQDFLGSKSKDLVLNMISRNARLEDYARAALEFEGVELK
jgi:curved DNA-binding protein CbpA